MSHKDVVQLVGNNVSMRIRNIPFTVVTDFPMTPGVEVPL